MILVILRVLVLALFLLATGDRKAFRVDYGLLLTFAAFFLLVDNLEALLRHPHAVFALSVGLSHWRRSSWPPDRLLEALLWGGERGRVWKPPT